MAFKVFSYSVDIVASPPYGMLFYEWAKKGGFPAQWGAACSSGDPGDFWLKVWTDNWYADNEACNLNGMVAVEGSAPALAHRRLVMISPTVYKQYLFSDDKCTVPFPGQPLLGTTGGLPGPAVCSTSNVGGAGVTAPYEQNKRMYCSVPPRKWAALYSFGVPASCAYKMFGFFVATTPRGICTKYKGIYANADKPTGAVFLSVLAKGTSATSGEVSYFANDKCTETALKTQTTPGCTGGWGSVDAFYGDAPTGMYKENYVGQASCGNVGVPGYSWLKVYPQSVFAPRPSKDCVYYGAVNGAHAYRFVSCTGTVGFNQQVYSQNTCNTQIGAMGGGPSTGACGTAGGDSSATFCKPPVWHGKMKIAQFHSADCLTYRKLEFFFDTSSAGVCTQYVTVISVGGVAKAVASVKATTYAKGSAGTFQMYASPNCTGTAAYAKADATCFGGIGYKIENFGMDAADLQHRQYGMLIKTYVNQPNCASTTPGAAWSKLYVDAYLADSKPCVLYGMCPDGSAVCWRKIICGSGNVYRMKLYTDNTCATPKATQAFVEGALPGVCVPGATSSISTCPMMPKRYVVSWVMGTPTCQFKQRAHYFPSNPYGICTQYRQQTTATNIFQSVFARGTNATQGSLTYYTSADCTGAGAAVNTMGCIGAVVSLVSSFDETTPPTGMVIQVYQGTAANAQKPYLKPKAACGLIFPEDMYLKVYPQSAFAQPVGDCIFHGAVGQAYYYRKISCLTTTGFQSTLYSDNKCTTATPQYNSAGAINSACAAVNGDVNSKQATFCTPPAWTGKVVLWVHGDAACSIKMYPAYFDSSSTAGVCTKYNVPGAAWTSFKATSYGPANGALIGYTEKNCTGAVVKTYDTSKLNQCDITNGYKVTNFGYTGIPYGVRIPDYTDQPTCEATTPGTSWLKSYGPNDCTNWGLQGSVRYYRKFVCGPGGQYVQQIFKDNVCTQPHALLPGGPMTGVCNPYAASAAKPMAGATSMKCITIPTPAPTVPSFTVGCIGAVVSLVSSFDETTPPTAPPRWAFGTSYLGGGVGVAAPQSSTSRETTGVANGAGQVFSVGNFAASLSFSSGHLLSSRGSTDAVVVAADALTGELAWAKGVGGAGADEGRAIAWSNGSVFLAGGFRGTAT